MCGVFVAQCRRGLNFGAATNAQAIIDQPIATEDGPLRLTVSLGLTSLGSAPADLDELLRRADVALYQAKQNGRNRVESTLD